MDTLLEIDNDVEVESGLTEEIGALWDEHVRIAGAKKASASELRIVRLQLAEKLFAMKSLLSRPGRGGQWRGWLSTVGIPRSTGDRLATRHGETLGIVTKNAPHEAISPVQQVEGLLKAIMPRLRRILVTREMASQFVCALMAELGLESEVRVAASCYSSPGGAGIDCCG
jgi:hypothetical protein